MTLCVKFKCAFVERLRRRCLSALKTDTHLFRGHLFKVTLCFPLYSDTIVSPGKHIYVFAWFTMSWLWPYTLLQTAMEHDHNNKRRDQEQNVLREEVLRSCNSLTSKISCYTHFQIFNFVAQRPTINYPQNSVMVLVLALSFRPGGGRGRVWLLPAAERHTCSLSHNQTWSLKSLTLPGLFARWFFQACVF